MLRPYQCLLYCSKSGNLHREILLAATGCHIFSFDAQDGSLLSTWPSLPKQSLEEARSRSFENWDSEHQAKRQKISFSQEASNSDSADIVVENKLDVVTNTKSGEPSTANIAKLVCTSDCRYVIAVTAEDKSVRVFDLTNDGNLAQLSER